ncbi:2,4'-dihydroxyacetophenone dioxygenase [Pseudoalteromonas sp. GCY]|uniref:2,4'-dihydroxyacetophenone dioxygenase family protein n=1 Tax=Pseudoalteromonas sp. GCY TaxID=2003316 RepID=UPI000BFED7A2|nr:2,4'-dihydroxyacetophenone dioxygenase family protein [Pseudoalteromonas sp. GCY]PHI37500.1 2,4'-dihydroxyacetophenone dioxygenase [Pseudoalteromonas sp. GCY]QQQ64790.1 2,4'-dihydroxyacetophenone dioxygenase family protein [Pseudoalteromonas sp. GCY]
MQLPTVINHQVSLLTVNTIDEGFVRDALPGVHVSPLFLDTENGVWVLRVLFEPGVTLPKHFHTGVVHLYTMSGSWHYLEYPDQPQTAGSYLYEPGGSIHQFHTPESNEDVTDTVMFIQGANINFDEDGNFINIMDAGWIERVIIEAAKRNDEKVKYIKPSGLANYNE